jgi:ABC-type amino acid transport substrate-binding protein
MSRLAGIITLILFLFVLPLTSQGQEINPSDIYDRMWAVVIGINNYQSWPDLEFCISDANSVKEKLSSLGFSNIITITDADATRKNILDTLGHQLKRDVRPNDGILIYFAGHGYSEELPGGGFQGYIIPYDGDTRNFYSTCISMEMIRNLSRRLSAKHICYIFDSCYSGLGLARSPGKSPDTQDYLREITKSRAVQIITAGKSGQKALESGGHGVFTKCLIDALSGKADIIPDNIITISELGTYLGSRVFYESNQRQTPQFGRFEGEGEFTFVLPSSAKPKIQSKVQKSNLRILTNAGGQLYVDYRLYHELEPYALAVIHNLEPGEHNILITSESYRSYKEKVVLRPGQTKVLDINMVWEPLDVVVRKSHSGPINLPSQAFPASGSGDYLIVSTNRYFPPMFDASGTKPVGFDMDLIEQVANDLGKRGVRYVIGSGTLPPVDQEAVDLGIGAISITPERKEKYFLSEPYYQTYQCVLTRTVSDIRVLEDLALNLCVVIRGSLAHSIAKNYRLNYITVRSKEEVFDCLKEGRADFTINDRVFLIETIKRHPEFRIADIRFKNSPKTIDYYDYYGIVIKKYNQHLLTAVNKSLDRIKQDGRLGDIKKRWFK